MGYNIKCWRTSLANCKTISFVSDFVCVVCARVLYVMCVCARARVCVCVCRRVMCARAIRCQIALLTVALSPSPSPSPSPSCILALSLLHSHPLPLACVFECCACVWWVHECCVCVCRVRECCVCVWLLRECCVWVLCVGRAKKRITELKKKIMILIYWGVCTLQQLGI